MSNRLTDEIIALSNSKDWDNAKLEWNFEYAYQNPNFQSCLCGHYPIKNICVIKNLKNSSKTEIGNCCVKKFLGILEGDNFFNSIKKIKIDLSKRMHKDVLYYLYEKKVLNQFEYEFYMDTIRKIKLSEKQLAIRVRINQKFIDFSSNESNSSFDKINKVLEWAKKNEWFSIDFIESLNNNCTKYGKLSPKQLVALDNIIKKNRI
jgi:hypothetical protein